MREAKTWDGIAPLMRGHIVALDGEDLPHVVLECEDEQGAMPRVLVQTLESGLAYAPTERVDRKFIKPYTRAGR